MADDVQEAAQNELNEVEEANRALIAELGPRMAKHGIHPVAYIKQVQFDLFFDMVYPQGSPMRGLFDAVFETVLNAKLEELKVDLLRADLTEGIHP
jgi:hypothetical protein